MKLSKTTNCSLIQIKFPRWKEGSIGMPTYKIKTHNERLNEKIDDILEELHNSWLEDDYERDDPCGLNAKQAITSLIKELVTEAKPKKRPPDYYSDSIDLYPRQCAANSWNKAIDEFEQNLLKALEEVNE